MATTKKPIDNKLTVQYKAVDETAAQLNPNLEVNLRLKAKAAVQNKLYDYFANEEKVIVKGAPFYQPYFGKNMCIAINSHAVYVPLDGGSYKIPKSFADVFNERIESVDRLVQNQSLLATPFEEAYAGEVDLIDIL